MITGGKLFWDLSDIKYNLIDGETLIIEFDAKVEGGMCDECENLANVTANECSGRIFQWVDLARVYVECDFTAKAGGPYFGDIDEEIVINGSASDGKLPYSFKWDLDNDGDFNDGIGDKITHSWSEAGIYIIYLKVIDDDNNIAEDYAVVTITQGENKPPNKPSKPSGLTYGKLGVSYTYESIAIDNTSDMVYYLFDWDDGTDSGWVGPYNSGNICQESHIWNTTGSYAVKVKAKDIHNAESVWSDPLPISMPKTYSYNLIMQLLMKILERFPYLEKMLDL
ncbi:MAG: PKD domain-containing protein [Candidatus Thermoplasmatota archaeon]|nr:PKD domain-containing protein [Candidatus Thermoplasmatota archaeon]